MQRLPMTITLTLPDATLATFQQSAEAKGMAVETYIANLLTKSATLEKLSFREFLAPLHAQVKASGMSDAEIDQLLDEAIAESRAQRKPTAN